MNLLEFRQFFRTTSGRYDLVNSDGSDNGLNTIVNSAQGYLDRLADIPAGEGRLFKEIEAGDYLVKFTRSRSVKEVWIVGEDSDGEISRLPLTKYTAKELRGVDTLTLESAYVKAPSAITQGRPLYYCPLTVRMMKESSGGVGSMMDVLPVGNDEYSGIYLMPPSDADYAVELVGNFYSESLSSDDDETFWTSLHPLTLYAAVMRQLEIIHRNSEGVRDWDSAIAGDVVGIDMDGVAQDISDITKMEG